MNDMQAFLETWLDPILVQERLSSCEATHKNTKILHPHLLALAVRLHDWVQDWCQHSHEVIFPITEIEDAIDSWFGDIRVERRWLDNDVTPQTGYGMVCFRIHDSYTDQVIHTGFIKAYEINYSNIHRVPPGLAGDCELDEGSEFRSWGLAGFQLQQAFNMVPNTLLEQYRDTMLDAFFGAGFYARICLRDVLQREVTAVVMDHGDNPQSVSEKIHQAHRRYEAILRNMRLAHDGAEVAKEAKA